jgi:septum formation protein
VSAGSSVAPRLVLASASPRRSALLTGLGLAFSVRPAHLDETPRPGEPAADLVLRLARDKAIAVADRAASPPEVVLAADTEVILDDAPLGKPLDDADATRMLRTLAGRAHDVVTGVALFDGATGRLASGVERTRVAFAPMSEREIAWYVKSGEPHDRAGAYAIQGLAALFVTAVDGNWGNVVGLPLPLVYRLAAELGYDLLEWSRIGRENVTA